MKPFRPPIPDPVPLWKWAAYHSKRHSDGLPLGLINFYKRAVRHARPARGESHAAFVKRALTAETQFVMAGRRAAGGIVPEQIEAMLAVEIKH